MGSELWGHRAFYLYSFLLDGSLLFQLHHYRIPCSPHPLSSGHLNGGPGLAAQGMGLESGSITYRLAGLTLGKSCNVSESQFAHL